MVTKYRVGLVLVGLVTTLTYLSTQAYTIYGGDAGDLASAVATIGIPHPPGYPLYTFIGVILNHVISVGTLAWRLGFLSSVSTIFTTLILYDLINRITKRKIVAVVSSLSFALSYPVWLYAIVVEVFALNNLFVVTLLWCSFRFLETRSRKYCRLLVYLFGLSVSHHHIILFLLPALISVIIKTKLQISRRETLLLLILGTAGLAPYLYLFIASVANPALNWMGEPSFDRFISLVTRQNYGIFRAGSFTVLEFPLRLLGIFGFVEFLWRDFRPAGVFLAIVGFFVLYVHQKRVWWILAIAFISYVFFLFYASYPLHEEFMLGTFERFMLTLYLIATIFLGYGIFSGTQLLSRIPSRIFQKHGTTLIPIIFFILPIGLFMRNYKAITPIKNDRTAEKVGFDILSSIEPNSIVFLSTDTPLFNTQYVYYSQNLWPQVKLIHFTKLFTPDYIRQLSKNYPDMVLPQTPMESIDLFDQILTQNAKKFPIYSRQVFNTEIGVWVPWGLLFRFYPKGEKPEDAFIADKNESLWSTYQDPDRGVLKTFRHLILSDVTRVYGISHQETGFFLARSGFDRQVLEHLTSAIRLFPTDVDSYTILAQVYSRMGKCEEAEETIAKRSQIKGEIDRATYLLHAINEAVCRKNPQQAEYFNTLYENAQDGDSTPLDKLL